MEKVAPLAPLEDACTVVILRDGDSGLETLMLERPTNSRAFGGAWVFPGGKIDPEDRFDGFGRELDELTAARVAGLRELEEETGQQLTPEELIWVSQWIPMQAIPRRFRTWFMMAQAAPGQIVLNHDEHDRYAWLTPAQALDQHARGEMTLVAPTWVTLHNLDGVASVADALAGAKAGTATRYNSHLLVSATGNRADGVLWAGDEAYPAADGVGAVPGARHRLTTNTLPWVFEHRIL